MALYKYGDLIFIRENLDEDDSSDFGIHHDMVKLAGKAAQITGLSYDEEYGMDCYRISIDHGRFMWSDDMFEKFSFSIEKPKYKIKCLICGEIFSVDNIVFVSVLSGKTIFCDKCKVGH